MSVKSMLKKWRKGIKGETERANPEVMSAESLRHTKKVVTFDDVGGERQDERQSGKGNSNKQRSQAKEEKRMVPPGKHGLKGHSNLLCCGGDGESNDDGDDNDGSEWFREGHGREFGGRGKAGGQLQDVTDIQILREGQIVVTDLVSSRLQIFEGRTGAGKAANQSEDLILEPWACAVTPDGGHVAVTSRKQGKVVLLSGIREEDQQGGVSYAGSVGEGHFPCPSGLAVTSQGEFIVTDIQANKVSVFNSDGAFLRNLEGGGAGGVTFCQPRYVTVSRHEGDIIVSDSGNHRLVVFSKDWKFVRTIGQFGKEDGCFKFPHAVCTDHLGNILVCDRYNDRVSAFTWRGEFVRHLLTSKHQLRHPQGLALSPQMDLYVSHGGLKAHVIRVLRIRSVRTS